MRQIDIGTIPGFEDYAGKYTIYDDGRVWSNKSQIFLKPYYNNRDYQIVDLCNGARRKQCKIHRLVAMAFIPNPLGLETVNHKDEDKNNNCAENLEWMSMIDNIRYGTGSKRSGAKRRKPVTCVETNVTYSSLTEAAADLGVGTGMISTAIKLGRACHGYHWRYAEKVEC